MNQEPIYVGVKSTEIASWSPGGAGEGVPPTQVHMIQETADGVVFVTRFKSASVTTEIIDALIEHRDFVWPKPKSEAGLIDQPFQPYSKPIGAGTLFAATLKFDHDPDLGEWSSVILFDDNRFNRGEIFRGTQLYRGWHGPTAPNILVESRAERYWQDICDLLNRAAEVFG